MTDTRQRVARSMREAIFKAHEIKERIISSDLMDQIEGEIRDFLAHEIMKCEDHNQMEILMEFFKKVTK